MKRDNSNHCANCGRRISDRRILCGVCKSRVPNFGPLMAACDEALVDLSALNRWTVDTVRKAVEQRVRTARIALIAAARMATTAPDVFPVLCLGGPLDGKLTDREAVRFYIPRDVDGMHYQEEHYRREVFWWGSVTMDVYVHDLVTGEQAMRRLFGTGAESVEE